MAHDYPGDGHEQAYAESVLLKKVDDKLREFARKHGMTTDPEEGQRQAEARLKLQLKVGDKVKLSAGTVHMTVVALEDYGNQAVCEYQALRTDTYPIRSLVRVDE